MRILNTTALVLGLWISQALSDNKMVGLGGMLPVCQPKMTFVLVIHGGADYARGESVACKSRATVTLVESSVITLHINDGLRRKPSHRVCDFAKLRL
mgnify:CR=1 FL=1